MRSNGCWGDYEMAGSQKPITDLMFTFERGTVVLNDGMEDEMSKCYIVPVSFLVD